MQSESLTQPPAEPAAPSGGGVPAAPAATPLRKVLAWAVPLLLIAAVAIAPYAGLTDLYFRYVAVAFFVNAVLAISFQLLFGYAKLVSFGHAALFAFGGYGTAITVTKLGWPPVVGWLVVFAVTAVFATVVGLVVLRLAELFLSVVTLAFGLALVILLQQIAYLGGEDGLSVTPLMVGGADQSIVDYYIAAIVFVIALFLAVRLTRFRFGRQLHIVGNDPVAARSVGLDVTRGRVTVFVICSLMAAAAGIVYAHTQAFVAPTVFGLDKSILILAMVVIGGLRSMLGAILGAALLTLAPEVLASFEAYSVLIYGALLIAVPMISPGGLVGIGRLIARPVITAMRRSRPQPAGGD